MAGDPFAVVAGQIVATLGISDYAARESLLGSRVPLVRVP